MFVEVVYDMFKMSVILVCERGYVSLSN